jgi:hypothetical protein
MKCGLFLVVRLWLVILSGVGLFSSCGRDRLDVDVSSISVPEVKLKRFDRDFFSLDTNNIPASLDKLRKEYGTFTDGYVSHIVCFNAPDSLGCDLAIRDFILNFNTRGVWNECTAVLGDDFSREEAQINDAFRHFRYYFPSKELPKGVCLDMTGFNYDITQVDGYYGISMEYYLGEKNPIYDGLAEKWPGYRRRLSRREYMVADFVKGWMMNTFPFDPPKNDLINNMVYQGKLLYLQKALLRDTPDSVITGYSQKQLDWCVANEAKMWATLIEQKKVYSEDEDDIQHFTLDGPFTPDFPRESPGKAGNWLGLRIVESYMQNNPKTTIAQLMELTDGQLLLNRARYKPKF